MVAIAARYEQVLALLSQSWALEVDVPARLRTAALGDLTILELQDLRSKLQKEWGAIVLKTAPGEMIRAYPRIWITPAARAP